ncbi:MAG: hypothetical protein KBC78_00630 [Candidatus Pacebacteria bacterium]|nr:hypothetical protein [Candidatus Paceibacterota bacterium]
MKKTLFITILLLLTAIVVGLVILNDKKVSVEPIVNNVATTTEGLSFKTGQKMIFVENVATTTEGLSFKTGQKMIFVDDENDSRCHDKDGFPALAFLPKTDSVFIFSNFETRLKEYPILNIDDTTFLVCSNSETNNYKVGILYSNNYSIVVVNNGHLTVLVEDIIVELNKQGFNITENPDDIIFNPMYFSSKNNSIIIGKNRYGVGGSSSNPLYSYSLETGSFTELAISKYHHDMNGILTNPNSPYSVESGKILVLLNFETDTYRVIYEALPNETLTSECDIGCKVENKWLSDDVLLFYVYYFDKKEYQKTGYRVEQYSLKQKRILDKSEWIGSDEDYVSKVTFFD